jgi:hypothetical protein
MPARPPLTRAFWLLAGAAAATALACAVFAALPPMPVRVGRAVLATNVPLGYQLSVFPAFGVMLASLALDLVRGPARGAAAKAALVGVTGFLSVARIAGALPLSGHAMFLFAAASYVVSPPADRDAPVLLSAAIPALLVVGWSKLVVWGDPAWFAASAVLGAGIGAALARVSRS